LLIIQEAAPDKGWLNRHPNPLPISGSGQNFVIFYKGLSIHPSWRGAKPYASSHRGLVYDDEQDTRAALPAQQANDRQIAGEAAELVRGAEI
jgi:hypothetical protein